MRVATVIDVWNDQGALVTMVRGDCWLLSKSLDILLRVKEQRCQFWSALTCQSFGMRRLVAAGPSSRALKAVTSYRTP
jgi:hypothetical protein